MFEKDSLVEEDITVDAFKRSVDSETLTKQQRVQKYIDDYNKAQVNSKIAVRMNPDFPTTRNTPKNSKKAGKKSAFRMVIDELGKRVKQHDLINNLAEPQAGFCFGHIARGDIDFAKNEQLQILSGK